MRAKINLHNMDCLEAMKSMSDNQFDLAIVDPPYGIGASKPSKKPNKCKQRNGTTLNVRSQNYKHKEWDNMPPSSDYFIELKRVSRHQIIWGVNYFNFHGLVGGRIIWDKLNGNSDQYDCEIAYNSQDSRTDIIRYMWQGMFQGEVITKDITKAIRQQGNKKLNEKRIHPTQKPEALYMWLLQNYAKEGDKILDTHLGSGSIAIVCWDMGFDLEAYELDKEYYDKAIKRFNIHCQQKQLF